MQLVPTTKDPLQPSHPIHKHSNKGYLIGSGPGEWTWSSVEEAGAGNPQYFNLVNPPFRDVFNTRPMLQQTVWVVVRYQVVNPGPWLFHCHIQTHLQGGMAIVLMDGVDRWPVVPGEYEVGRNGY